MQNYNAAWSHIEPYIRETIEELAQQSKETYKQTLIIGVATGLCLFLLLRHPIGPIGGLLAAGIYYLIQHNKHNDRYKAEIVPKLIGTICPNALWMPNGAVSKEIITESRLYDVNNFHCEDTIIGRIDKTDFTYSEVTLSHTQMDKNHSHEVIDFKGFIFHADFNKDFNGMTLLSSNRTRLSAQVGFFSGLERCHLEDSQFDSTYRVYTTNDQEARYILSPALQQRILNMHDTFCNELKCKGLSISFHHSKMLIMVQSYENNFEVKYSVEEVKKDLVALKVMIGIIEMLNLNTRIWTKE